MQEDDDSEEKDDDDNEDDGDSEEEEDDKNEDGNKEEETQPPFACSLIGFCWRGYNRHGVQDRVESLPFLFLPLKILSPSASSRSLLPNPSF